MDDSLARALRSLPSVAALLRDPQIADTIAMVSADVGTQIVRKAQESARVAIRGGDLDAGTYLIDCIIAKVKELVQSAPTRVINGSGVIIQTNLGRAPVSREAGQAMREAAEGYVALETELASGERGGRGRVISDQLTALTGAERTLVVNNNAAAVFLMLSALCRGRDVLVSRGEAVEIGGGFRIPDVLRQSGANLVEVGTTNRTYVSDFEQAITENTAAILKVHASNFAIIGFTATPATAELAALCRERGILLLEDAGSGCLLDTSPFGLAHEPTLSESLAEGVDVVCASGDKLLGGPQAGIILGKAAVIDSIARHPLARAVRADKTCLAGVSATLRHYVRGDAVEHVPVWWSISRQIDWLHERCEQWTDLLEDAVSIVQTEAVVGGGSLPGTTLPSVGIAIEWTGDASALARTLRLADVPIVPRIVDDQVVIDARTVLADEDDMLIETLRSLDRSAS